MFSYVLFLCSEKYANLSLADALPEVRNRRNRVWQVPNPSLAAAKLWFGSCQTRVWQLPNTLKTIAKYQETFACNT